MLRLLDPMLARSETRVPTGDFAFEVKWDGFRAIPSTDGGWRMRSRRGWNMAPIVPELARDDVCGMFDGELIAIEDGAPSFPLLSRRMLHGVRTIPVAYAVFDVLALDGASTVHLPYSRRRELLESLELDGFWFVTPAMGASCSRWFASTESKGSSRSRALRSIGPANAAGSRSRTEAIGGSGKSANSRSAEATRPRSSGPATQLGHAAGQAPGRSRLWH